MYVRFVIVFALFILSNRYVFGQYADIGSWNILGVKYNHTNRLSFLGEGQLRSLRFYNHFHYYEFKGGIHYRFTKALQFSLGLGSYQTYREGGDFITPKNNDELRVWPQLTLFQQLGSLKVEQRYRMEMRWTSNGYRNRVRYRLGINYPFSFNNKAEKPFQFSLNNELFFSDKEPYFERNRIQAGFSYKLTALATIQLGYLHQFDYRVNDEIGRDFFVLGYFFDLTRKGISPKNTASDNKEN